MTLLQKVGDSSSVFRAYPHLGHRDSGFELLRMHHPQLEIGRIVCQATGEIRSLTQRLERRPHFADRSRHTGYHMTGWASVLHNAALDTYVVIRVLDASIYRGKEW